MTPLREFERQQHTRDRGRLAESEGVAWLRDQGYRIVARNTEYRTGEIDVVAREGETLCFIEIKARAHAALGGALEAVTPRKQRQIAATAALYLAENPFPGPCRFDVLAMDGEGEGWSYSLVRDAFQIG